MKKIIIGGILHNRNYTMLKIVGLPNEPGYAGKILTKLGRANINLHFIAEAGDCNGLGNITICISPVDAQEAIKIISDHSDGNEKQKVEEFKNISTLTVYGPHFREKPTISGEMCSALGHAGVNILGISTSISSVCCLVQDKDFENAYEALLKVFELP